ncbi:16S rRNA (uracil(1498)-N(3))-methyltransferase [Caulobacter segnis]|uniref:16S rRNA (uracil(1498)-N(3))-methyltransferase n=1 Tax=Caulobacter segnis TaxID=88688 RepID=UPI0024107E2B|nr:16S rRNA (uracil(1498)-N(3))-methyltransferase [Caulobacter segnis]MDG2520122.1 16S rRNA (uracil(1498)-N(3))-methyltransferase [Caulobacter segnis]
MIRLFVPDALKAGGQVSPSPDQARYLTSVMRLGLGDAVLLFNGRDGEWRAVLSEVSKKGAKLIAEEQTRPQHIGPDLDLVVALVKRNRLETIVEKAAELGARRVRLLITRRTNADHTNVGRLQAIATEAAEQTGRLDVPQIVAPEKLDRMLDGWDAARALVFCDEGGDAKPALEILKPQAAAVLIGPEGGFAPEERERLRALDFVTPISLGPRILRADTAAISALTLWQAAAGDWRS